MNWLTNLVRPKIQALMRRTDVPDNFWTKCESCGHMLFRRDLLENLNVCHHCDHHMRLTAIQRLELLFDQKTYQRIPIPSAVSDPLKFKDSKRYADRLKDYRHKTSLDDALIAAHGLVKGYPLTIAAFEFAFMGGSMGVYVGNGILEAAKDAVRRGCPLLVIPASGGARMQEGILSLMQMPKTTIAVEKVKNAGLPYITLLTDPTTGGVSASFAMLGDISISEPKATIGFTGARVIQETIRQTLPDGFQLSEYLLEHGMIDMVVHRRALKETLGTLLSHLCPAP